MKVLAVELSSGVGSVALVEDEQCVCSRLLPAGNGRSENVFGAVETLRAEAGWSWSDVALFAAGRGPGRYSGMRIALTAVRSLALPGEVPVRAVSSGAALAGALAAGRPDTARFLIVGDARRERIWLGDFVREGTGVRERGEWRLLTVDELRGVCNNDASLCIATSEWDRLEPMLLRTGTVPSGWCIEENVYPSAEWVARLALAAERAQANPEPLAPIYLHPPVARPPARGA